MSVPGEVFRRNLAKQILAHRPELLEWYHAKTEIAPPPFYLSVDLRDSGHKIVPVDCNLYPAGFNNICSEDIRTAPSVIRAEILKEAAWLGKSVPSKILLIPEAHTQNSYYLENLAQLQELIEAAGFEVKIGWPDFGVTPTLPLKSFSGKELTALPIHISSSGVLTAGDFTPDIVLLNNDFSGGYPQALDTVRQPLLPSHRMGWHTRKKSEHFVYYNQLAREFAQIAKLDPWIFQIDTEEVSPVNFNEGVGVEQVIQSTTSMLSRIQHAYNERGIQEKPFVFIKNNAGTYGMGIMVVHTVEELQQMNRRTKNKMTIGKGKSLIESVVVQEGIPTLTRYEQTTAEPVIYMVGCDLMGGFLRTHPERSSEDNLNAQGMIFKKLCMSDLRDAEKGGIPEAGTLEIVYGAVARISALAAALEIQARNAKK